MINLDKADYNYDAFLDSIGAKVGAITPKELEELRKLKDHHQNLVMDHHVLNL